MSPSLILGAMVILPIVVLLLLRINAALVFLSLCLGAVLVQFIAPDADSLISMFSGHSVNTVPVSHNVIRLILLLGPAVLTAIFMIRTVRGKFRLILNILPSAGVGLLGALLVVPLLPPGLSHNIMADPLWDQVQRSQDLIVGGSTMVCLFVLWLQRPKTGGEGKHEKKHHKG